MEQRISLVTLGVADLARARRFYAEGLGWKPGFENEGVVFFDANGMVVALFGRDALLEDMGRKPGAFGAATGNGGITLAQNLRSKEAVDALMEEATRAGATLVKPAQDTFWGGYSGYFADLDGHVWEIAWNPYWTLDAEGRVSMGG